MTTDRAAAEREIAAVNEALAAGYPIRSIPGQNTNRSAIRAASDQLGVGRVAFAVRVGTPEEPGSHHARFGIAPDWGIAAGRGELGTKPVLPGWEMKRVSTKLNKDGEVAGETIVQAPAAGGRFEVPSGHVMTKQTIAARADGRIERSWIRTQPGMSPGEMVGTIRDAFEGFEARAVPAQDIPATVADLATVYPIADAHIGLLTWHRETGVNWDLSIAQTTIRQTVTRLVAAAPASKQAVVLGLGDLLHADGYDNCTPRSKNVLDVDGRYPKILRAATHLMIDMVDAALSKHEQVLVRVLRGNHDRESAIAVALGLSLYYAGEPRVTVDDDPGYFWWWSWGSTLLGATHGDAAKMATLPLVMATRASAAWGQSRYRHILTGHIHTKTAIEMSGVTVESLQTPAPADAWHHEMGYGAGRSMTAITYHRDHGETGRVKVNVVPAGPAGEV